jgi:hypothetical protein
MCTAHTWKTGPLARLRTARLIQSARRLHTPALNSLLQLCWIAFSKDCTIWNFIWTHKCVVSFLHRIFDIYWGSAWVLFATRIDDVCCTASTTWLFLLRRLPFAKLENGLVLVWHWLTPTEMCWLRNTFLAGVSTPKHRPPAEVLTPKHRLPPEVLTPNTAEVWELCLVLWGLSLPATNLYLQTLFSPLPPFVLSKCHFFPITWRVCVCVCVGGGAEIDKRNSKVKFSVFSIKVRSELLGVVRKWSGINFKSDMKSKPKQRTLKSRNIFARVCGIEWLKCNWFSWAIVLKVS